MNDVDDRSPRNRLSTYDDGVIPASPSQQPAKAAASRAIDPRNIEVIDDVTVAALRRLTPEERVRIGARLNASCERAITESLRFDCPEWTDPQIRAEVRRRLGRAAG